MPVEPRAARAAVAHRWAQTAQRTGRHTYQMVMTHVTNPDHYEASRVAPGSPPLSWRLATPLGVPGDER
jgi:hypothetical protein